MITGVRFTNLRPPARKTFRFPNPYYIMITGVRFTNLRPPARKTRRFPNPYYIKIYPVLQGWDLSDALNELRGRQIHDFPKAP